MNKNVPNILTMSRIFCTPLVVLFFLLPIPNGIGKYIAFAIYVLACFTDLLDGKIARKYNLVSDFGKFMDQIADKFITTTAMILVLFEGVVFGYDWASIVMILIVVLRDILLSGIRMVAANKNVVISADIFGKVKSFFLDTANGVLMFYLAYSVNNDNLFADVLNYLGLALMIFGVILAVFSCVNYSRNAVISLKKFSENMPNGEDVKNDDGYHFEAKIEEYDVIEDDEDDEE